jgi:transcriptional regulator with XRE-family HTH domain
MIEAEKLGPTLGLVIGLLRQERSLSQEHLAHAAGLHRTSISLIERGCKSPTVNTLACIANALGIEPSKLLKMAEAKATIESEA